MTIAATTDRIQQRPCDSCGSVLEHRENIAIVHGVERRWWSPDRHAAPCGFACIGGGVKPAQLRANEVHGRQSRCPKCGPLRVLPEVVEEMRARANAATAWMVSDPPSSTNDELRAAWCCTDAHLDRVAADLLRALDEIDKLRAERDDARKALADAREQVACLDMALALAEEQRRDTTGSP